MSKRFFKYCSKCGKKFIPIGSYYKKQCTKCFKNRFKQRGKK